MAEAINSILGDMVVPATSNDMKELPSPEELKNRVLIKGKLGKTSLRIEADEEIEEVEEEKKEE